MLINFYDTLIKYFFFIRLEEYMQEIQNKKKLLQTEINRIQSEMNSMKMQIPTEPLGCLDPKVLQQKVRFYLELILGNNIQIKIKSINHKPYYFIVYF